MPTKITFIPPGTTPFNTPGLHEKRIIRPKPSPWTVILIAIFLLGMGWAVWFAINGAKAAASPTLTPTNEPTFTPFATSTPSITLTPSVTSTPSPTPTSTPTQTPVVIIRYLDREKIIERTVMVPAPTSTPMPTYTPNVVFVQGPTQTPWVITVMFVVTATPTPTFTPTETPTATTEVTP